VKKEGKTRKNAEKWRQEGNFCDKTELKHEQNKNYFC
jgi:hypothetical protein